MKRGKTQNWKNNFALGISFPTGSIDLRDRTPASNSSRLGYNMQNGTGTYDSYFLFNNVNIFGKLRISFILITKGLLKAPSNLRRWSRISNIGVSTSAG